MSADVASRDALRRRGVSDSKGEERIEGERGALR